MRVRTPSGASSAAARPTRRARVGARTLAVADEADEELDTAVFCPECAAREFLERPEAGS
jgi:hypothetical protein